VIVSTADQIDALERFLQLLHRHRGLPAVGLRMREDGDLDLTLPDPRSVAAWAAVLGERPDEVGLVHAWMGAHEVAVHEPAPPAGWAVPR